MAKQNTTAKQASGGGYQFENEAVAYILTHLLNRSSPFGLPQGGVLEQVAVQRPAEEWHLDDLVVTVHAHGYKHRLAFSIKSNTQISKNGFPSDFVRDAWEHLLHETSTVFDESRDYLGLITVPADRKLQDAVYELLRLAHDQSPSNLANQVDLPKRTNDIVRSLFKSAECPEGLATKHVIEQGSAGRLLRRVLWLPLDFEDQNSVNRGRAHEICLRLLRSGNIEEVQALWAKLKEVAERLRRAGGDIDLGRLADELRGRFELRDFPNYEADWERLSDDTVSALSRVRSMIGGAVTLPRLPEQERVQQAFVEHRGVVLLGASGTGKSAIAKGQAESAMTGGRALWLDSGRLRAGTFAEWRSHLGLDHALSEIVRTTPTTNALLVLDDLDRLYNEPEFATAAEFVRAVRLDDEASPWRVLITCTPEAWDRVRAELASHGGLPARLEMVNIGPPAADELSVVWSTFPQLLPLQARYHLAPVLFRPKVLDLLATRATAGDDLTTVGEADLARWFWDREVTYGPHSVVRTEAARQLAQHFADTLVPDVSVSAIATAVEAANLSGIDELVEGRVLRRVEGRIAFDHDLYGDWIRLRQLVDIDEAGELSGFLAPRLSSPVWHRALRLYGIHLLEQSNDLKPWTSTFAAAGRIPAPAGILAQDILLESMAFASASGPGLFRNGVWPLLAERDGRLLERLLNRLLHTATIPNPAVLEVIAEQNPELAIHAAAWARLPYPFYWSGILALLYRHREETPLRIRGVAARVAELWLRATSPEWPLRKEAAGLAVALGEALLKDKEERDVLFLDDETDQQVYRAVLASGHEEPQAVTQIVLEASGRRARRHKPPPLSQEELARLREKRQKYAEWSFVRQAGPLPKPWPHGPAFRVDGALQKAVLERDALQPLAQANSPLAVELLLALLISEPERRHDDDYRLHDRLALEWPSWQPPFYTHGPFRAFLATAEADAVTAILRLVDHATDRWAEAVTHNRARERRCSPNEVEPPMVPILVDGEERGFIGNAQVFGWSQGNPDSGGVIGSTLTALEKHLYDRVEAGNDITSLVQRLLAESRSLAMIGLLSMFGRRYPQYLRGPLRGLLVSPHVLEWSFIESASTWWELPLQWGLIPEPLKAVFRIWHEMPHRRRSLRKLASFFFVHDLELRLFFEKARKRLQTALQPGGLYEGWPLGESLIAEFDPDNYTRVEGDDGMTYIQYTPPDVLLQSQRETEEALETEVHLMAMPFQCRQLLDRAEAVPKEVCQGLWASAQQISALDSGSDEETSRIADALTGIAAVLVQRGGEWRTEYSDAVSWARQKLLDVAREDRQDSTFFGAGVRLDRLDFVAETLPRLWADQPEDHEVRQAVAHLVIHSSPEIVATISASAAAVRRRLGEEHLRLLHTILLRAGLEARIWQVNRRARWRDDTDSDDPVKDVEALRRERGTIEHSFVDGTLKANIPGLDEIAPFEPLGERRGPSQSRRRKVPHRLVEESLLIAAYRGVPDSGDDEGFWVSVWERIVVDTVSPLAPADSEQTEDIDDLPDSWGKYLMERVAGVVAAIENPATARRLWEPIISLGASASQWVSGFARNWISYALFRNARGPVIESWIDMIDLALTNSRWGAGDSYTINSHRLGELWRDLLGFNFGPDAWTDELRPRVQLLRSRLAKWVESHFANPSNVRAFARFLVFPAARDLIFEGLIWLDRGSQSFGDRFWGRFGGSETSDEAILSLLVHVWGAAEGELRRNKPAFIAFRSLLQVLVSRQYPAALELADRVGSMAS